MIAKRKRRIVAPDGPKEERTANLARSSPQFYPVSLGADRRFIGSWTSTWRRLYLRRRARPQRCESDRVKQRGRGC